MRIDILTMFPQMFSALNESILKKAKEKGLLTINILDIRDFSTDLHKKCDDYPYGGGSGMVMTAQPLYDAIMSVKGQGLKVIYLSPRGQTLTHAKSVDLSKNEHLIFVCGHYEGIDQRVIDLCVDEELSIGDYVLTGGELACMVVVDSLARHIDGVLGNNNSTHDESFASGMLEYPHYTRPQVFNGLEVPAVLLSGNHAEIEKFRRQKSLEITKQRRPDLLN